MEKSKRVFNWSRIWYAPAGALLAVGMAYLPRGFWYVLDWRVIAGHGYEFFDFTLIMFGLYGLFLVHQYGRRGFFLSIVLGLGCDVAQTLLNTVPKSFTWEVFIWNSGLAPIAWVGGIIICWWLSRPYELSLGNVWVTGMLVSWLLLAQLPAWIGPSSLAWLEPATETSWIIASYNSVRPA